MRRTCSRTACAGPVRANTSATATLAAALAAYKRYHAVREAEFATTRQHAARAAHARGSTSSTRRSQATQYREQAALLAEDKVALVEARRSADRRVGARPADVRSSIGAVSTRRSGCSSPRATATRCALTVALIDIDHFKTINDSFSHIDGRRRAEARRRRSFGEHCRANDLPVRYGGDEFLLVLSGADREGSARVLRRLKDAVDACTWASEPRSARTRGHAVDRGCRHACGGRRPSPPRSRNADRALYAAKAGGRDRIVYWPSTRN